MNEPDEEIRRARGLLIQYAFGSMMSQVVAAAAELQLPDRIGDEEVNPSTLAESCETDEQSMTRLLRCLAALDIVRQTPRGNFTLTPAGQVLRDEHSHSMRDIMLMWADPAMLDSWRRLTTSIREGRRVFDDVFGVDFFGYLRRDPALAARFHAAMSQGSAYTAQHLPMGYDFGRFSTVVDIGGGDGTVLAAVLREHPQTRGILFDTPDGVHGAAAVMGEAGVGDRCQIRVGDFFESVPEGGDLYLLKSVIHDWNDAAATTILRCCHAAMNTDGRLLIVEPVLPDTVESPPEPLGAIKYLSDLNMLVNLDGRERIADDFTELLNGAGFRLDGGIRSVSQLHGFQLIEARRR